MMRTQAVGRICALSEIALGMPPREAILEGLVTIANDWRTYAVAWHLVVAGLFLAVWVGRRPTNHVLERLLALPLMSVSGLAWISGNPFNGTMFAILALMLVGAARRLPEHAIDRAPRTLLTSGALLVGFAWIYPHFLRADSWTEYLYAAPLGLLPCPTLSAVIGLALMFNLSRSTVWSAVLAGAGLLYGTIGVFRLGVTLDYVLLAGATILAGATAYESFVQPLKYVASHGRA
jgi:hypothetical protein